MALSHSHRLHLSALAGQTQNEAGIAQPFLVFCQCFLPTTPMDDLQSSEESAFVTEDVLTIVKDSMDSMLQQQVYNEAKVGAPRATFIALEHVWSVRAAGGPMDIERDRAVDEAPSCSE